jgi:aryl-alcohol dehydrogenase-like predicted oxidoreductase
MIEKIILGTVQFGLPYGINNPLGQTPTEECFKILDACKSHGMHCLDTADQYGESQTVLHKYFSHRPDHPFLVSGKFLLSAKSIEDTLQNTLQSLGISSLDTYSFHHFSDFVHAQNSPAVSQALALLRNKGLIKNIGVSIYTPEELAVAAKCDWVNVIQTPFNLFDHDQIRGNSLKLAKKAGKVIHVRSVFLQGLFFMSPDALPEKVRPLAPALHQIQNLAQDHNISIRELALNYALHHPKIDRVLVGVDTHSQLLENISSIRPEFSETLKSKIEEFRVGDMAYLDPRSWK